MAHKITGGEQTGSRPTKLSGMTHRIPHSKEACGSSKVSEKFDTLGTAALAASQTIQLLLRAMWCLDLWSLNKGKQVKKKIKSQILG